MRHIVADTFLHRHGHLITAIASVVLAAVLAGLVDRALRRAQSARMLSDRFDAGVDTRLRFMRRVIETSLLVIGIAVALSQFTALDKLAASVLASGAIAAAVIGFAARQTLANAIAGLLLAVTQPLRLGDVVTFEGETGTVEDVRLTYTFLRTGGGARIVIPNERLAAGILHNDTVLGKVTPEVSAWLAPAADVEAAITAIEAELPDATVTVAESAPEGTRLAVSAPAVTPSERAAREAELRRAAVRAAHLARAPSET
jgi:small-conductance mechanosensitive channel